MSQLELIGSAVHVNAGDLVADAATGASPGLVASATSCSSPCSPSLALVGTSTRVSRRRSERGLVSAEWAMAIIAAVAIVGVLVAVLTSGPVKEMLTKVIVEVLKKAVELI